MSATAMADCSLRSFLVGSTNGQSMAQNISGAAAVAWPQKCPVKAVVSASSLMTAVTPGRTTTRSIVRRNNIKWGTDAGGSLSSIQLWRRWERRRSGINDSSDGGGLIRKMTTINCSISSSSSGGNVNEVLTIDNPPSSSSASSSSSLTSTLSPTSRSRDNLQQQRSSIRLALPSKGRMAEDTLELLRECELNVKKPNPRQYIAKITELEAVEVWFQRASDVVRKVRSGDVDFGIVGYDMLREYGEDDEDLVLVHDSLGFGHCHLAIGIPTQGRFAEIQTFDELAAMAEWTDENPLRVVTGYTHVGGQFLREKGVEHVQLLTGDGALEAAPAMGTADVILDLVSSGTTLRENNLKEIEGGTVLNSQGVLIASRKALLQKQGVLEVAHELLERIEAHLRAKNQFVVTANIRGESQDEVARRLFAGTQFTGLQGPTISRVYNVSSVEEDEEEEGEESMTMTAGKHGNSGSYFAICVIVPKTQLYSAIRQLRGIGGSGVLVSPLTYIFDEEPVRWRSLMDELGLS